MRQSFAGRRMNKPLPDDTKVSVARLCTAAEKLLQETERLRRGGVALNQRVQPIEEQGPGAARVEEPPAERKGWEEAGALNLILAAKGKFNKNQDEMSVIRRLIE